MQGLTYLIIEQALKRKDIKDDIETWKQGTVLNALHFCGHTERLREVVADFAGKKPLIMPGAIADDVSRIRALYHSGFEDVARQTLDEFKTQRIEISGVTQHANARPTENWVWIDSAYMVCPSMALMGEYDIAFGDLLGFYDILVNENGLMRHLKQEMGVRDDERLVGPTDWIDGTAWGRGNGWFVAATVDTLAYAQSEQNSKVEKNFLNVCESLLNFQDDQGIWHAIIDDLDTPPEMSGTTAIAYAFLRASRMGILPSQYEEAARRAIAEVLTNYFDWINYQVKNQQTGPMIANLFTPAHMESGCSYGQAFLAMSLQLITEKT